MMTVSIPKGTLLWFPGFSDRALDGDTCVKAMFLCMWSLHNLQQVSICVYNTCQNADSWEWLPDQLNQTVWGCGHNLLIHCALQVIQYMCKTKNYCSRELSNQFEGFATAFLLVFLYDSFTLYLKLCGTHTRTLS